ncbi:hypothetical protein M9458_019006, partial [Cirrhinus mrigala]
IRHVCPVSAGILLLFPTAAGGVESEQRILRGDRAYDDPRATGHQHSCAAAGEIQRHTYRR